MTYILVCIDYQIILITKNKLVAVDRDSGHSSPTPIIPGFVHICKSQNLGGNLAPVPLVPTAL